VAVLTIIFEFSNYFDVLQIVKIYEMHALSNASDNILDASLLKMKLRWSYQMRTIRAGRGRDFTGQAIA
jgi:hypothetical protein